MQKNRQKNSPSAHHRTTLSGYIFASKARINNLKKMLNSNIFPICPHNMVNFGPLAAEICWRVWGTPSKFQWVSRLGSVTARHSSSGRQPNFATLKRGRHLYSAGWPSRRALADILVYVFFDVLLIFLHSLETYIRHNLYSVVFGRSFVKWFALC